ncbi:hypothetical protein AB0K51_04455 [Kitasatospora sp. NPDC049285]|uniref:hypothetical protein n=1 Tax=Kitasatospora sp. NPDC049285 TaxID=3157096 RepID=UPI0034174449
MTQPSALLQRLEAQDLLPTDAVAVLYGGAEARGWADPVAVGRIRIVTASPHEGPAGVPEPEPASAAGHRVVIDDREARVSWWTGAQLRSVIGRVSWERLRGATVAPLLGEAEELVVEDLLTGSAELGGELLGELRREAERSAFQSFVRTRSLGDAEGALEDAAGQLRSGDVHSAVLSARKAFGHLVDNMLEEQGCYGTYAPELRARRFVEAAPPRLGFAEYWAVETMRDLDPAHGGAWVEQVLAWCAQEFAAQPADLVRRAMRGPRRGW